MKRHMNISVKDATRMQYWGILQTEKSRILNFLFSVWLFELLSSSSWLFGSVISSQLTSDILSFSSILGLKGMAKSKMRVQESAMTLKVFLQPTESRSTWVTGPQINIPNEGPMVTLPVAKERFLLKYFATIRKQEVRQKLAPSPVRTLKVKNMTLISFTNDVAISPAMYKSPPMITMNRQLNFWERRPTKVAANSVSDKAKDPIQAENVNVKHMVFSVGSVLNFSVNLRLSLKFLSDFKVAVLVQCYKESDLGDQYQLPFKGQSLKSAYWEGVRGCLGLSHSQILARALLDAFWKTCQVDCWLTVCILIRFATCTLFLDIVQQTFCFRKTIGHVLNTCQYCLFVQVAC